MQVFFRCSSKASLLGSHCYAAVRVADDSPHARDSGQVVNAGASVQRIILRGRVNRDSTI